MTYFKKWIYEETQENLEKNISLLHKTFFWAKATASCLYFYKCCLLDVFEDWNLSIKFFEKKGKKERKLNK